MITVKLYSNMVNNCVYYVMVNFPIYLLYYLYVMFTCKYIFHNIFTLVVILIESRVIKYATLSSKWSIIFTNKNNDQ